MNNISLAFKLALRNITGGKLRTLLNIIVLSFAYIIIIWHKGFIDGWVNRSMNDMISWEIGGGQYWHEKYDPYDPLTIYDSHAPLPELAQIEINKGRLTPILISQGTIYPEGRLRNVILKGVDPNQIVLDMPTSYLSANIDEIPIMLGATMAKNNKLKMDDYVTVRWRDANGTFDAAEAQIVHIFSIDVPSLDNGIVWLPIQKHREMIQLPNEASIIVTDQEIGSIGTIDEFNFKDHEFLLADFYGMIKMEYYGGAVMYLFLLLLALVAIFDTQVLSIFRRQKEIGTHIALGMTQKQVISLFTVEGTMYAIFAALLGAVYGIPILVWQAKFGFNMPVDNINEYGIAISQRIYPIYSIGLIIITILIIMLVTTFVSYLPARRIAKIKPTEAIKGKIN
jgi:ABC-type lipoprotein release transport system permease subunit